MKLSDIRPARGAVKKRKRVGCGTGSGHGKTCTRGHKGQKSRSGGGMPPWFEGGQMPLQRRVPKRGFTNIFKSVHQVVNIDFLNRFEKGTKIDRDALHEAGLVRKASQSVKILGRGELKVALEVEVDAVSRSAAKAILDAGGSVRLASGVELSATDEAPARPAEEAGERATAPADETEEVSSAPAEETEEVSSAPAEETDNTPTASDGEIADTSEEDRRE